MAWQATVHGVTESQTWLGRHMHISINKWKGIHQKLLDWDFPSGPEVRTLYFHCRGYGFLPGSSCGGSREFEAGMASARIRKQLLN